METMLAAKEDVLMQICGYSLQSGKRLEENESFLLEKSIGYA